MPGGGEGETATVGGARDHARSIERSATAQAIVTRPTIPASQATDLPPDVAAGTVVWDETLGAGGYASRVVRRGVYLRITDVAGGANLNLVLHHAARPVERLNVADTVKLQWNAYPGAGSLLLSDMGRVLATVLPGSDAPLDLLCGASLSSGRPRLLLGLAKHGLTRRDLPAALNVFSTVRVEADGGLRLDAWGRAPGRHLALRAELDLLVTVALTPHPLDERQGIDAGGGGAEVAVASEGAEETARPLDPPVAADAPGTSAVADAAGSPGGAGATDGALAAGGAGGASGVGLLVRVTAWQGEPADPADPSRLASPESRRAFENTDDVLTALPAVRS